MRSLKIRPNERESRSFVDRTQVCNFSPRSDMENVSLTFHRLKFPHLVIRYVRKQRRATRPLASWVVSWFLIEPRRARRLLCLPLFCLIYRLSRVYLTAAFEVYLPGTTNDYLPCHTVVAARTHYAGYTSLLAAMCACDRYRLWPAAGCVASTSSSRLRSRSCGGGGRIMKIKWQIKKRGRERDRYEWVVFYASGPFGDAGWLRKIERARTKKR